VELQADVAPQGQADRPRLVIPSQAVLLAGWRQVQQPGTGSLFGRPG
jgi:hypothetical protein